MIKVVAFDFDGTLADTLPLCVKAFQTALEPRLGRIITLDEVGAVCGVNERGMVRLCAPDYEDEGTQAYLKYYDAFHDLCPAPFPGVKEALGKLKRHGIAIALITGKGAESCQISLVKYGMEDLFSYVFTGDEVKNVKAENLTKLLLESGSRPEECLYVGDAVSDVTESGKVGIKCLSATWATLIDVEGLKAINRDLLSSSVDGVIDYILSL